MAETAATPPDRLSRPTVYGRRAKLGVIVPTTNTANEAEWNMVAPADVSIHAARMPLHEDTSTEEGERALYRDVRRCVGELAQADVDVIAYGCTAGSLVMPYTALPEFMEKATGRPAVTTAQSLIEAMRALGASRLALATPYGPTLNRREAEFLGAHGFEIVNETGLGYGEGGAHEYRNIARIPQDEIADLVRRTDSPEAEAILISCTDLATFDLVGMLEAALGKPVISSNQATLWLALRRAGIADRIDTLGKLFRAH